jgi:hypothetical protein
MRFSRVSHERADDGTWELACSKPVAALGRYVEGYMGYVESSDRPLRRRELPTGRVPLILNLGVPFVVAVPGGTPESYAGCLIARVSTLPAVTEFVGTSCGIQVNMTPLGAHMFTGLPMHEVPEPVARLDELLGSEVERLREVLFDAPDWAARFDLLDSAFARRLTAAKDPAPSIEWAWSMLRARAGRVETVGSLSASAAARGTCSRAFASRSAWRRRRRRGSCASSARPGCCARARG